MSELIVDGKFGVDRVSRGVRLRDQFRQAVIALRTDDEVDDRRAADDFAALGLRDAAGDRYLERAAFAGGGLFRPAQAPELGENLLGRLLADMAGVEDDEIGLALVGRLGIAFARERIGHALRVIDVHLAAV
jgi:hypothetical protein